MIERETTAISTRDEANVIVDNISLITMSSKYQGLVAFHSPAASIIVGTFFSQPIAMICTP
jgi:hypothetical protein